MAMPSESVRTPTVAGAFYPSSPEQLKVAVERFLVRTMEPVAPIALMVPHAGYIYSGSTAGKTYASADLPRKLIILCPNHTGLGAHLAYASGGSWRTPLGEAAVDQDLAGKLASAFPALEDDPIAHRREHAIEVQLPFLQVFLGAFSFVPIVVGMRALGELEALGLAMARVIAADPSPVGMIISSDMNHYEDAKVNREKDSAALDALLKLDAPGLYRVVNERQITMCGYAPAVAVLFACSRLGANRADLVDYTHSGTVTGDSAEVVSYAGVRIYKGKA